MILVLGISRVEEGLYIPPTLNMKYGLNPKPYNMSGLFPGIFAIRERSFLYEYERITWRVMGT